MLFCPHCGFVNPGDSEVCSDCGKPLEKSGPRLKTAPAETEHYVPKKSSESSGGGLSRKSLRKSLKTGGADAKKAGPKLKGGIKGAKGSKGFKGKALFRRSSKNESDISDTKDEKQESVKSAPVTPFKPDRGEQVSSRESYWGAMASTPEGTKETRDKGTPYRFNQGVDYQWTPPENTQQQTASDKEENSAENSGEAGEFDLFGAVSEAIESEEKKENEEAVSTETVSPESDSPTPYQFNKGKEYKWQPSSEEKVKKIEVPKPFIHVKPREVQEKEVQASLFTPKSSVPADETSPEKNMSKPWEIPDEFKEKKRKEEEKKAEKEAVESDDGFVINEFTVNKDEFDDFGSILKKHSKPIVIGVIALIVFIFILRPYAMHFIDKDYALKKELEKVLAGGESSNPKVLVLASKHWYDKKDYEKSLDAAEKALDIVPEMPEALFVRGKILMDWKNDYDGAFKDIQQAVEVEPDNHEYRYYRGVLYEYKGNNLNALKDYDQYVVGEPLSSAGHLAKGRVYVKLNEFDKALEQYRLAQKKDPDDSDIPRYEANAYFRKGEREELNNRNEEAIVLYQKALKKDPNHENAKEKLPKLAFKYSKELQNSGKTKDAIDMLDITIKYTDSLEARAVRGKLYLKQGELEKASRDFGYLYQKEPANHKYEKLYLTSLKDHAEHERLSGNFSKASDVLNTYVSINPLQDSVRYQKAKVDAVLKKYSEVDIDIQQLSKNKENHQMLGNILILYGNSLIQDGSLNDAVDKLNQGLVYDAGNPDLYLTRALAYARKGNTSEAENDLKTAVDKYRDPENIRIAKGRYKLAMGDTKSAIEELNNAVISYPNSAEANYYLGLAYEKDGDGKTAKEFWQKGQKVNDISPEIKYRLKKKLK
ncbi:MAG: tetratricopeptide repeat protein [Vulcanimicrobiota bacterium]